MEKLSTYELAKKFPSTLDKALETFELGSVLKVARIPKGFSSENFEVKTSDGLYFLKKHRINAIERLGSIERCEQFFSNHDIPVIAPLVNNAGELHSCINDDYYTLYPFIAGEERERGNATPEAYASMGAMLGKGHRLTKNGIIGAYLPADYFQLQDKQKTISEINALLSVISPETPYDQIAIRGLKRKKELVIQNSATGPDLEVRNQHLCFGDYYTDNVFFDGQDRVTHIFDLDMAGPAPRMFELVRSCMLTCFWYDMSEEKIFKAKNFINAYYEEYPFTKKQLQDAIELTYLKSIHSTWRERRHYLKDDNRTDEVYPATLETMEYLHRHREELCNKIAEDIL